MQTDHTVLANINVTDSRQKAVDAKKVADAKPKEKTPAEQKLWDEGKDRMHDRMFPNAKKEAEEKETSKHQAPTSREVPSTKEEKRQKASVEKTDAADNADVGKKEAVEKETEPKPETKPPKEERPAPVDYERLATSVATATAKAIKESTPAKTEKPEEEVPEARRRDLAAVEYLDQNNPRYKGKAVEYKKFSRAEADYVARWEKENVGRKFDADSDEHTDWYDKHEPEIDPEDITDARVELAAERKAKALYEKESVGTKKEVEQLRLERDIERAERAVPALASRNIAIVGSAMGEEVAKAMGALKESETLEDTDPAAHTTLMQVLPELHEQTAAAARIFGTEGRAYNGSDPAHKAVAAAALELETLILSQPEENQKDKDGRTFSKLDEWAAMTTEQKAKHWTIGADLMSAHLGNKAAEKAEKNYKTEREKAEKMAKAYGYTKNGAPQTERPAPTQEREENEQENVKTRSPSTSTRTVIQPGTKVATQTYKDGADHMLDRMFRR